MGNVQDGGLHQGGMDEKVMAQTTVMSVDPGTGGGTGAPMGQGGVGGPAGGGGPGGPGGSGGIDMWAPSCWRGDADVPRRVRAVRPTLG